jgi:hypothetical protein
MRHGSAEIRFFFPVLAVLFFQPALSAQSPAELLRTALQTRGLDFEEGLIFSPADELFGLSLLVHGQKGPSPRETPVFVLAVPIEGPVPEKRGELPFRFKTALSLADLVQTAADAGNSAPSMNIITAFLGYWDSRYPETAPADSGSIDSGDMPEYPGNTVVWYLDLGEAPASLEFLYQGEKTRAPLSMIGNIPRLCAALDIPFSLKARSGGEGRAAEFLRSRETAALYIRGGGGEKPIDSGRLARLIAAYWESLEKPGFSEDYHYSAIPLPGPYYLFIPETVKVILALSVAALLAALIIPRAMK